MIRSLFAYVFIFTAGLACAAAYFYSLHPEHSPEDDMPRMRIDLEDALQRAQRAKDAWERPAENSPQKTTTPPGNAEKPRKPVAASSSVVKDGKRK